MASLAAPAPSEAKGDGARVLASRKAPILVLSKLLGHASIATMQRYAHLFDEALREGVEKAVR
jgi:site-specific recombinase XerD